MEIKTKHDLAEELWFLEDNKVVQKTVIKIEIICRREVYGNEGPEGYKNNIGIRYSMHPKEKLSYFSTIGSNGETILVKEEDLFKTKEDLLKSL